MRRCIAFLLVLLIAGSVQAEGAMPHPGLRVYVEETGGMEMSGLLGGLAIDVGTGNLSNSTGDVPSNQWPTIAEVYTATWCGNCLDSEHAIEELTGDHPIEILHYHREYSEISDPFGTEVGDDRWIARYGVTNKVATDGLERLPPSVVFNGEWLHSGSVPKVADTLSGDYQMSLDLGKSLPNDGLTASLTWSPDDGNSTNGTASWSMDRNILNRTVEDIWSDEDDCIAPEGTSVTPVLFIVENIARYEDGSNGLEYYPHVIRDIIRVENATDASSGFTTIQMPDVWDGEDLRLVLALEWSTVFISWTPCSSDLVESIDRTIPSIGVISTLAVIGVAALSPRLRNDD